jgi:hypothetical protein
MGDSHVRGADFASNPPRFVFERADGKHGTSVSVAEILLYERFEAATSFALSDMHELVQDQLAIAPAIGANDNSVSDGYAARSSGNDIGARRGISQLPIVGQGNSIDDQHFHPGTILHADSERISDVRWP